MSLTSQLSLVIGKRHAPRRKKQIWKRERAGMTHGQIRPVPICSGPACQVTNITPASVKTCFVKKTVLLNNA